MKANLPAGKWIDNSDDAHAPLMEWLDRLTQTALQADFWRKADQQDELDRERREAISDARALQYPY